MRFSFFFILAISLFACKNTPTESKKETKEYSQIGGQTMGTTYTANYEGTNAQEINKELDQLFIEINEGVSTYIKTSLISTANNSPSINLTDGNFSAAVTKHFTSNLSKSLEVAKKTEGMFDPTVMPLVNYWGFGYDGKKKVEEVDKAKIAILMQFVGHEKIIAKDGNYEKPEELELDFSALAKGYAADQAGQLLESKGIQNYLVEIGGEVYTKGKNENNKEWVIGVNTPEEDAPVTDFQAYVGLSGKGMATSGNYRNFYESNGEKFSHTINPKTGFPERSSLLSATIIADDCMSADAYATACMVAGLDKSMEIIKNDKSLEGYFIFADKSGTLQSKSTEGFSKYLLE